MYTSYLAQSQVASSVTADGAQLSQLNIKAPKNGYVYAYVSDRSDEDVYFNNFKVGIQTGNIIEENHYYAYGLKIAAISSRKFPDAAEGNLKNNYQYQGAFNELDEDIGWNDFALRNYDAQIGRWMQQDPYQEFASPYVGMGNDPENSTDHDGGGTLPFYSITLGTSTASAGFSLGSFLTSVTGSIAKLAPTALRVLNTSHSIASTTGFILKAFEVANILNNSGATIGVTGDPIGNARMLGVLDAWANATSIGIYDLSGHSHWSDYDDNPALKRAYLEGRIMGDAAAILQSDTEIGAGGGIAATGVGAVFGGALVFHGAFSGGVASADAAKATALLVKLNSVNKTKSPTIGPFKEIKKVSNYASDEEVHHLIEKRFKDLFGEKAREMISKILTRKDHAKFTKAWRDKIPYGKGTADASPEQVIEAAREIYKNDKDILKALEPYFKKYKR